MRAYLSNTKYQFVIAVMLLIIFMVFGWIYAIRADTADRSGFGDVLRAFAREPQFRLIIVFILIDLLTGVIAALRMGIFDAARIAQFLTTNVIPYVFGFLIFWFVVVNGLADLLSLQFAAMLANVGFGAVATALTMSIVNNAARASMGSTRPSELDDMTPTAPAQG